MDGHKSLASVNGPVVWVHSGPIAPPTGSIKQGKTKKEEEEEEEEEENPLKMYRRESILG